MDDKADARKKVFWSDQAADQLDYFRSLYSVLHEAFATSLATRNALFALEPRFAALYDQEYRRVLDQLGDEKALLEHMLKKQAGALRNDPFWKD